MEIIYNRIKYKDGKIKAKNKKLNPQDPISDQLQKAQLNVREKELTRENYKKIKDVSTLKGLTMCPAQ